MNFFLFYVCLRAITFDDFSRFHAAAKPAGLMVFYSLALLAMPYRRISRVLGHFDGQNILIVVFLIVFGWMPPDGIERRRQLRHDVVGHRQ